VGSRVFAETTAVVVATGRSPAESKAPSAPPFRICLTIPSQCVAFEITTITDTQTPPTLVDSGGRERRREDEREGTDVRNRLTPINIAKKELEIILPAMT
jgi:hypothetical protein